MHRAESRGAFTVLSQLAGCCILEDILLLLLRTMARPARATRGKQERGVLLVEHLAPLRQELGSLGIFGLFLSQNTRTRLGTTRLNASELRFGRAARARVFCLRSICAWGSCASFHSTTGEQMCHQLCSDKAPLCSSEVFCVAFRFQPAGCFECLPPT